MAADAYRWALLSKAADAIRPADFAEYFELRRLLGSRRPADHREFQVRFARYYRLNNGGLTEAFKRRYFQLLFTSRPCGEEDPYTPLLLTLYRFPRRKGDHSLQASFVSKLVAIHDESRPLYDVHVRNFFGMAPPAVGSIEFRIAGFVENLRRIQEEYESWTVDPHLRACLKSDLQRTSKLTRELA